MNQPPGTDDQPLTAAASSPFRMVAEWEPQRAIWLAWPHNQQTWPTRFEPIPEFYVEWIERITESVPVKLLAAGECRRQVAARLKGNRQVQWVEVPTNDCWIRDYGPIFVAHRDGSVHAIDWQYNAWGGKYPPWQADAEAARAICRHAGLPRHSSSLCLEGGALETDGRGRLLTTPECLVTPTRNPGWTAEQISQELHRWLGVEEILWLDGGGLEGDDTDGHIDQLARFIDPGNVVAAVASDRQDPNFQPLQKNFDQLKLWGTSTEPAVTVHPLPIPPPRYVDRQRVPESYCNFLRLGPERLMMPTFGADTDAAAEQLLRDLSGADVVTLDCRHLAWGLGALHCASRDEPQPGLSI